MVKKNNTDIQEVDSSFGVAASVADPVGGTVTPPGGAKGGEGDIIRTAPTSVDPKTKVAMMSGIIQHLSTMKKEDVKSVYQQVAGVPKAEQDRPTQGTSHIAQPPRVTSEEIDVSEDIAAIFEGSDLSDDIKARISTVFETALITKINEKLSEIAEATEADSAAAIEQVNSELVTKVDNYLDYVVENWMEENKLAVDRGLRSELVEDFLSGLKNLFAEHYIDVPDEKVNVVDELASRVEDLETKLSKAIDENVELKNRVAIHERAEAFAEVVEGLTESEAAKLEVLSDSIVFSDKEMFVEKIKTLRENYFPTKSTRSSRILTEAKVGLDEAEGVSEETEKRATSAGISAYVAAISRTLPKK
jgi:hypothetical protein